MRILIPIINYNKFTGSDASLSEQYGKAYIDYTNKHVFSKTIIPALDCKPSTDADKSLCYQFSDKGGQGDDFSDWTNYCGGAGWNISVLQLSFLVRYLRYTNNLLTNSQDMVSHLYGFDDAGNTQLNVSFVEKGGYFPSSNNKGEFNGRTFLFSNDVSIVLYINSQLNYPGGSWQLVVDAFKASNK